MRSRYSLPNIYQTKHHMTLQLPFYFILDIIVIPFRGPTASAIQFFMLTSTQAYIAGVCLLYKDS